MTYRYNIDDDYDSLIIDDDDDDIEDLICDGGDGLDTQWIVDLENQLILSDYEMILPADIRSVSFRFVYLARDKVSVVSSSATERNLSI